MIYFTSDWHFNHDQPFVWEERGFETIEEMNNEIVKRHNSIVTNEDDVYVLGDLCMSGKLEENKTLIESLNGRIHILIGNHDTDNRLRMYESCSNVVEICGYATLIKYRKYRFYLSHYPTNTGNYDDGGLKACTINLCGHVHSKDPTSEISERWQLSYHIEMDAHDCYPISAEEVILDLKHAFREQI